MANAKHLAILDQGAEVWNQWRRDNSRIHPDLNKAKLHGANLRGANLRFAFLGSADLSGANLSEADLASAELSWVNLSDADLSGTMLYEANLKEANLSAVKLVRANLIEARMIGARLNSANLSRADLSRASLNMADLSGANLREAHISEATLAGANLSEASIGWTLLGNVDLSQVKGLENVHHGGPSTIGIDTIYRSVGNIPEEFLRGAGVPDQFIAYTKSLVGKAIEYYSAFISHSHKDEAFATRLFADLQNSNVRAWYAPEDLKIGEKIRPRIDESIYHHDKLLLILSEHSVTSDWVEHEVETALAKEREQKKVVLFPVRIDNSAMEIKTGWSAHVKNTRHIGDFCRWKDHDAYQIAFERLLRDLKTTNGEN